jgi:hypothetical protein
VYNRDVDLETLRQSKTTFWRSWSQDTLVLGLDTSGFHLGVEALSVTLSVLFLVLTVEKMTVYSRIIVRAQPNSRQKMLNFTFFLVKMPNLTEISRKIIWLFLEKNRISTLTIQ